MFSGLISDSVYTNTLGSPKGKLGWPKKILFIFKFLMTKLIAFLFNKTELYFWLIQVGLLSVLPDKICKCSSSFLVPRWNLDRFVFRDLHSATHHPKMTWSAMNEDHYYSLVVS
jgi:hypothetical protein